MARVSDHENLEVAPRPPQQLEFGGDEAGRRTEARAPLVTAFPDVHVVLEHVDPGPPQARDHLRVPRVVTLVGAEVEGAHQAPALWFSNSGAPSLLPLRA